MTQPSDRWWHRLWRRKRPVPTGTVTLTISVDGRRAQREIKRAEALLHNIVEPLDADDAA